MVEVKAVRGLDNTGIMYIMLRFNSGVFSMGCEFMLDGSLFGLIVAVPLTNFVQKRVIHSGELLDLPGDGADTESQGEMRRRTDKWRLDQ
jgi:hypothetical protein